MSEDAQKIQALLLDCLSLILLTKTSVNEKGNIFCMLNLGEIIFNSPKIFYSRYNLSSMKHKMSIKKI